MLLFVPPYCFCFLSTMDTLYCPGYALHKKSLVDLSRPPSCTASRTLCDCGVLGEESPQSFLRYV